MIQENLECLSLQRYLKLTLDIMEKLELTFYYTRA